MPATSFIQFIFPLLPCYGGAQIGVRINRVSAALYQTLQNTYGNGYLGYNPVGTGKITASQSITLSEAFTIESLGEYERTMHDINAKPVVPKIEISLGDFFFIAGTSNGSPVNVTLASFLDEVFSDPTALYEVWCDRWDNTPTLQEVWFVGDVDYNTIPSQHRYGAIDALTASAQYPLRVDTITANFATERLTANINRTYQDALGVNWVPGSIMDMVYGYKPGDVLQVWELGGLSYDTHSIYCGSSTVLSQYKQDPLPSPGGITGAANSGLVRGYGYPPQSAGGNNYFPVTSPNIRNLSIAQLASLIASYGGFYAGQIDTNMMFDLYAQLIDSASSPTKWPLYGIPIAGGAATWSNFFVNANFLFGNGIPIKRSFSQYGVYLTGTSGHTGTGGGGGGTPFDVQLSGTFYDYYTGSPLGIAYFGGTIASGTLYLVQCSDNTYSHELGDAGGGNVTYGAQFPIAFSGSYAGGSIFISGGLAGANLSLTGTYVGTSITLNAAGPLTYNWPCTVPLKGNVMGLALWIAIQTGTFVDTTIDTSGNVTLIFRARRPALGTYFTGTHLTQPEGVLDSNEDASEVAQSSLTVQCQGDDLVMMAGPDSNNAVAITAPWRCHKFGSPTSTSSDTIFYNPGNNVDFCIEQWWNRGAAWNAQFQCVTCDAKIADGVDNAGKDDDSQTQKPGVAIPTSLGWVGGTLLLWLNSSGAFVLPSGEFLGDTAHQTSNAAMIAVAAIVPHGVVPPKNDEMCGGYFNPQTALCQFYYQEMAGNKLVLVQTFAGFLGDDGTIQGLHPGLVMQTFLRGKTRTMKLHNVKIDFKEGYCVLQWVEIPLDGSGNPNYNNILPNVVAIGGSGTQSSSSASSSAAGGGGGSSTNNDFGAVTTTIAADTNDWSITLTNDWTFVSVSNTDTPNTHSITGIANGLANRIITITNTGANAITLVNQSASSLAANRFLFLGVSGIKILGENSTITFFYDGTIWRELTPAV